MGEEVKITDYDDDVGIEPPPSDGFEERVREWEDGLPSFDELTPLSYALISPELASAFRISPEQSRTMFDVNRASRTTFSSLRGGGGGGGVTSSNNYNFKLLENDERTGDQMVTENDDTDLGSDSRKIRRVDDSGGGGGGAGEEADSALRNENCVDDPSAKNLKRPRLVWTPQLHKRFVDVVAHLGIKNAVPKTIMQLMNVEGLTRENVASHLQKYRLYLKRMQGLSNEGPSSSDHLFASTPVPQSLHESGGNGHGNNSNGHMAMPIPMPYPPQMVPMPMMGMSGHPHGHGVHVGMPVGSGGGQSAAGYHHQYNMVQQRDWSGNKFASYHQVAPNDN